MSTQVEEFGFDEDVEVSEPSTEFTPNLTSLLKVNFADNSYALVDEGTYIARVKRIEVKQGEKGPYLNIQYIISDEDENGVPQQFDNSFVWQIVSLSPKVAWRLKKLIEAFIGNDAKALQAFDLNINTADNTITNPEFFARTVLLTIKHEPDSRDSSKTVARVDSVQYFEDSDAPNF